MRSFRLLLSGSCLSSCAIAVCACAFTTSAYAQSIDVTPAHVAAADGRASLERDGQVEPLNSGMPFVPGDQVRTEAGRVEILFPDGSALDVDEFTSVDLMSPTLLRVTSGRVVLVVFGAGNPSSAVRYQIDTPAASAATDGPGEYRVSIFNGSPALQTELAVTRGWAALSTESGTTPVRAGERTLAAEGQRPSPPQLFNSARFDAFDRWVAAQRGDRTGVASSGQYLPDDLRMYSNDFDRNGSWGYEESYGNVWYPAVSVGWRPYYNGYWSSVHPYGWTWIGFDRWAWPTHHYGRWGYRSNRWFWMPARHWAPAWVSWGVAPGYVSWCPLGFNNQPVFALSVGFGNVWTGWTAVPRSHFSRGHVGQWAVGPDRLGGAPFARSTTPPVAVPPVTHAVPRVVMNGSQPGAVARPSFANRQQIEPRAQIRPRSPQSPVDGTAGRAAASAQSPFPARNPTAGAAPSSPGSDRRGGSIIPRQPGSVAPGTGQSNDTDRTIADRRQPPDGFQRQPVGTAPIARPNERQGTPRSSQPGTIVRPETPREAPIARPAPAPENSQGQGGAIAPRYYGRDNSNGSTRQGSAVPRNESQGGRQQQGNGGGQQQGNGGGRQQGNGSGRQQGNGSGQQRANGGGQQQGNGGGQSSNGGGAQSGAAHQGGQGARQRHP